QFLSNVPQLCHAGTGARLLPAIPGIPRIEAEARSQRKVSKRLVSPLQTPVLVSFCIVHSALKVSVIGLAPIKPGLKDRLLELLCIHGRTENSNIQNPSSREVPISKS